MTRILGSLALVLALTACADDKNNSDFTGETSAMKGSIVGHWATVCEPDDEVFVKKELLFDNTSGMGKARWFKDSECKGPVLRSQGPNTFTYTVENKASLGQARLMMKVGEIPSQPGDVTLFDDSMTIHVYGLTLQYNRVSQ